MIEQKIFGALGDGRAVEHYILTNGSGASLSLITYGAITTSIVVPDRNGRLEDVVLGFDTLAHYRADRCFMGIIAGRYGNRIARGRFSLGGREYVLPCNDGPHHLHGGMLGFGKVLWKASIVSNSDEPSAAMTYYSPAGEEGYPGAVMLEVVFTLTAANEVRIAYRGTTDAPTLLNPTYHSYFNLTGDFNRTILEHQLAIDAELMTPVDNGMITTGSFLAVEGTPFDFRRPVDVGERIDRGEEQLRFGKGYDHNWVLNGSAGTIRPVAEVYEPHSGRVMTVLTDQPGLQFYSGNHLDGTGCGKGKQFRRRTGFCLEAQCHPDSPNKSHFPSTVLLPGREYRQTTSYKFSVR